MAKYLEMQGELVIDLSAIFSQVVKPETKPEPPPAEKEEKKDDDNT